MPRFSAQRSGNWTAAASPSGGTCFRGSSLSSRSNLQLLRRRPAVIRSSKPSRAPYSSQMVQMRSRRKFAWNGPAGSAPLLVALNPVTRVSSSIAALLRMARRRSIARCATSWRTSWLRRAPAGGESRRMGRNGDAPALISELRAKRVVTISLSRFAGRNAATFIPVRIAGVILHAPGRSVAAPPVSPAAGRTIAGATISDSNSNSLGVRQSRLGATATRRRRGTVEPSTAMTEHRASNAGLAPR